MAADMWGRNLIKSLNEWPRKRDGKRENQR